MNELPHFEIVEDHAEYRPAGHVSLSEGVQLVASAIAFAREQRVRKLLVVVCGLTGFESPGIGARYFLMREWAHAASGFVRVALVARPEMIDPQKFGVTVATNLGFCTDIFASEVEALSWLLTVE